MVKEFADKFIEDELRNIEEVSLANGNERKKVGVGQYMGSREKDVREDLFLCFCFKSQKRND